MESVASGRAHILTMDWPARRAFILEQTTCHHTARDSPASHYPECEFAGTRPDIDDSGAFRDIKIVS